MKKKEKLNPIFLVVAIPCTIIAYIAILGFSPVWLKAIIIVGSIFIIVREAFLCKKEQ